MAARPFGRLHHKDGCEDLQAVESTALHFAAITSFFLQQSPRFIKKSAVLFLD